MTVETKTKHTPGPWEYYKSPGYESSVNLPNGNTINQSFYGGDSSEEREANARLIASAPEMLEALKAIDEGFKDNSIKFTKERQSDSDPYHKANTLMCKAIAKAEGES